MKRRKFSGDPTVTLYYLKALCNLYHLIQFDFENRKREIHSRNKDQNKWYSAAPPGFTYCLKEAFCAATP